MSQVDRDSVPAVWAMLLPMIERALAHGVGDSTTQEQLLGQVLEGRLKLWVIHAGQHVIAGLVIGIKQFPAKKTVAIELAAGKDMDVWIEQIEQLLLDFRDLAGADTIECACRAGLAHRLGKRGWERKAVVMQLSEG